MNDRNSGEVRVAVREMYSKTAQGSGGCGCGSGCCGPEGRQKAAALAQAAGYTEQEILTAPEGANLGLGCGNPQAIAALRPGEVVLDLGSGAGFDCFLAARQVGPAGRVIGVDMTPAMVEKARGNAAAGRFANVSFRLGEIEHLPVGDAEVDVMISNCVVNLSTDKAQVFREAYRVLKPGGRVAMTDIVALAELPEAIRGDIRFHAMCLAGAERIEVIEHLLADAGFRNVAIRPNRESGKLLEEWFPGLGLQDILASAVIEAVKE